MRRPLPFAVSLTLALGLGGWAFAQPSAETPHEATRLPIVVTVAETESGDAAASPEWFDAQVAEANTIFADASIAFEVSARETMGSEHARMEDRRDRHRLGRLLHAQRIDVFVVASLRDVDEPDRFRQGVHWRPRGAGYPPRAHYVILSAISAPTVLAHELGHYFGNPHSDTSGNIMSYDRGDVPPRFDPRQLERIRFTLRDFTRNGSLLPIASDAP